MILRVLINRIDKIIEDTISFLGIETIEDVVDKQLVESLKSGEGLADALSKQTDFPEYKHDIDY